MKSKNIKIMIGSLGAAVVLFLATPFFPFDELAALAIALIAGIMRLSE